MLNARIQIRILGKWWQLFTIHLKSLTLGIVGQNYHSDQLTPFRRHSVAMWGLWCPFSMRGSWQENTHDNPNPQVSLTPHSVGPAESRFTCSSICNWVTLASRVAGNPSLKHFFQVYFRGLWSNHVKSHRTGTDFSRQYKQGSRVNISEVVAAMDFFGSSKVIVVPFDHGIARVTLPEKTLVMIHDGGAPSR